MQNESFRSVFGCCELYLENFELRASVSAGALRTWEQVQPGNVRRPRDLVPAAPDRLGHLLASCSCTTTAGCMWLERVSSFWMIKTLTPCGFPEWNPIKHLLDVLYCTSDHSCANLRRKSIHPWIRNMSRCLMALLQVHGGHMRSWALLFVLKLNGSFIFFPHFDSQASVLGGFEDCVGTWFRSRQISLCYLKKTQHFCT